MVPALDYSPDLKHGGRNLPLVYVVEDDEDLREETVLNLNEIGFSCIGFGDASTFYKAFVACPCSVAVIDIGLPGEDGLSIVTHLRELGWLRIVLVTARGQLSDRVDGLRRGADAYFVKPVNMTELSETLKSLVRRLPAAAVQTSAAIERVSVESNIGWELLESGWIVRDPSGLQMVLTTSERLFMSYLFSHAGQTVSRDELISALGGDVYDFDQIRIDALASRLRGKAKKLGMRLPLHAVRGAGYMLAP